MAMRDKTPTLIEKIKGAMSESGAKTRKETPLVWVDAFTAQPFAGNPAAVCLLDGPADPAWMQRVAMEMNLAETAGHCVKIRGESVTVLSGTLR